MIQRGKISEFNSYLIIIENVGSNKTRSGKFTQLETSTYHSKKGNMMRRQGNLLLGQI